MTNVLDDESTPNVPDLKQYDQSMNRHRNVTKKHNHLSVTKYLKQVVWKETQPTDRNEETQPNKSSMDVVGGPEWNCLQEKQNAFKENRCQYDNCFVTHDRSLLNDYTKFDAILINGKHIVVDSKFKLPKRRSPKQLYVFATKDSAANYPVCNQTFDNYFNLTWTYRLDSDVPWPYFSIEDEDSNEIGPRLNMGWRNVYDPVGPLIEPIILDKKLTVAWVSSNCFTSGLRESLVEKIKYGLKRYYLDMDIIGACNGRHCPKSMEAECMSDMNKLYFYLAFEDSVAEDYVTEKVVKAFQSFIVPVVFGGANYSRFLPPHSYLDAGKLGAEKTAYTMAVLMKSRGAYKDFFRWRNYYSYSENNRSICGLCEILNKDVTKVYPNFREWWNPKEILAYGVKPHKTCNNKKVK
ncbi:alpha-(1,3)-fucosyltransferase C-like [Pectinophora gossypiella]|uniref:alpha-(1,3)-fucosyltransferase C-like n=1 Tax=Pectinophora gossypiella TaxID=13191 RepID=UPI00214E2FFE|nr:alpha-(1,3)-fucosyltransferase C-like [Pectinophora gossypiella]